jgi:hypothetical protein
MVARNGEGQRHPIHGGGQGAEKAVVSTAIANAADVPLKLLRDLPEVVE